VLRPLAPELSFQPNADLLSWPLNSLDDGGRASGAGFTGGI
jgi:hypothetical protein